MEPAIGDPRVGVRPVPVNAGAQQMDLGISGRIAVVTGGDSGMGYATAEFLLREGVKVVLADIDDDKVQETARTLAAFGEVRAVAAGITGATGDFLDLTDEAGEYLRVDGGSVTTMGG